MKMPKWTDVHRYGIARMSWGQGILRMQFDHPLYYYRYQNVPEALWLLMRTANELCQESAQEELAMALAAIFDGVIKSQPKRFPFKKLALPGKR